MTGHVTRIIAPKGYGFVWGEDEQEYFFHKHDFLGDFDKLIDDILRKGKIAVSFEPVRTTKGLRGNIVARMDGGI